jgi:hypothetical protein
MWKLKVILWKADHFDRKDDEMPLTGVSCVNA